MSLRQYNKMRDFKKTREPSGKAAKRKGHQFVVQKHYASHLHYDFRLELNGALKSWAVPKGPSMNPGDKRLAVQVEDHPVSYAKFEGEIPKGEYGAGQVIIWDKGTWFPLGTPESALKKGRLEFELHGEKLKGKFILVRTRGPEKAKKPSWLLIKRHDEEAQEDYDVSQEDLPDFISPQLAMLTDKTPTGDNWIFEIKFDGYRTQVNIDKKQVKLLTRSGLNWTSKYLPLQKEFKKLKVTSAIIDGEIVVNDDKGVSSFFLLQKALKDEKPKDLLFYAFDLMFLNGQDLTKKPLIERKTLLRDLLKKAGSEKIIFSEHWDSEGQKVYGAACEHQLEGIIAKRADARYETRRSDSWLKVKCKNTQEFVIGGYTLQDTGSLAALLVGVYNDNQDLEYVGRVGTGFNAVTSKMLLSKFKKLASKDSAFDLKSPKSKEIRFVKPSLVANVEFGSWTSDHILRHAAYKGLREDKKAEEVEDEVKSIQSGIQISNPDKILIPKGKITKANLAEYYGQVMDLILPHISNRPLAVLRCPDGIEAGGAKKCFFQKHLIHASKAVHEELVKSKTKDEKEKVMFVDSRDGVLSLVQLGCLELHMRGGSYDDIDHANLIVFDFDPGPGVPWTQVKKAALELKEMLEKLDLKSFVKTSGGKGLHVHVPVAAKYEWEDIKEFARTICQALEKKNPKLYTTTISKSARDKKIFLDYLRNGYGATAVVPYSIRAKDNAPIALPIQWKDLKNLSDPQKFILKDIKKILPKFKNPWPNYFKLKQKIKILEKA